MLPENGEEDCSKDYAWEFITSSRSVTKSKAEITYLNFVPSAATADAAIYNGQDANGKLVLSFLATVALNTEASPKKPIYCDKGIFIHIGSNITGLLIQWRDL
jgi:hypothetical protein